ncbi:MAG: hypothetical protein Q8O83_01790 [bacterium]|nr:hypothetical protein [bacterium]
MFKALKKFLDKNIKNTGKHTLVFFAFSVLIGISIFIQMNFNGPFNYSAVPWFLRFSFPSAIEQPSLKVCNGPVRVYVDINFKGASAGFGPGEYTLAKLKACGISNNTISSFRVPSGYRVILYNLDNFGGASIKRTVGDSTLVDDGWNDKMSSMKVESFSSTVTPPPPSNTTAGLAKDHGIVTYDGHKGTFTRHGYSLPLVSFYAPPTSKYSLGDVTRFMKWYAVCRQTYTTLYGSVAGPYFDDHRGVKTAIVGVAPTTCGAGCGAGMKAEILQSVWNQFDITNPGDHWIAYYEMGRGTKFPFYDHMDVLYPGAFTPHYTALRCGRAVGVNVFATNNNFPGFSKEVAAFKSDFSLTLLDVYIDTNAGKTVKRNDTEIIPWDIMAVVLDGLHNKYGTAKMKNLFSALSIPGLVKGPRIALCNFEKGVKTAMGQAAVDAMVKEWKMPKCTL